MKKVLGISIFVFVLSLLIIGGCAPSIVVPGTPTPGPTVTVTATPGATTGSITGLVSEKGTGIPLADVTIKVDGKATKSYTTAADGTYTISGLSEGYHQLSFEKVGYKTVNKNVYVTAGTETREDVEMENTKASVDLSISEDTYIVTGSSSINGSLTTLIIGAVTATEEGRILMKIDTSSLPVGAKVITAQLRLYKNSGVGTSDLSCKVYPLIEDWNETTANWFNRIGAFPWFKPGGNYDETQEVGSATISVTGLFDWVDVEITKAFEYWESHDNYGIIIVPNVSTATALYIFSKEAGSSFRPYVEVDYYIP